LTITIASVRALFETDLKKIVALSTLSQLGVIILSLGLGANILAYFHLLRHAFFKALLFLCAGSIIHIRKDYQDLRLIGRRFKSLPLINRFTLVARISLIGLPFMSAFFSKEVILEKILLENFNFVIYLIILLGIFLTACYRTRFLLIIFSNFSHNDLLLFKFEENKTILKRISYLFFPASFGGYILFLFLFSSVKLSHSRFTIKITILVLIALGIILRIFIKNKDKLL
jgi:NADH-ubiquinone oxidoreductase chain 5